MIHSTTFMISPSSFEGGSEASESMAARETHQDLASGVAGSGPGTCIALSSSCGVAEMRFGSMRSASCYVGPTSQGSPHHSSVFG